MQSSKVNSKRISFYRRISLLIGPDRSAFTLSALTIRLRRPATLVAMRACIGRAVRMAKAGRAVVKVSVILDLRRMKSKAGIDIGGLISGEIVRTVSS